MAHDAFLTYEMRSGGPTKQGNLRMTIEDGGAVRVQRNTDDPPAGQDWTEDLPDPPTTTIRNARRRLLKILDAGHFFEMDTEQVDELTSDGNIRLLRWTGERGPRTVIVDRARSPDFDRIIAGLAKLTAIPGL